MSRSRAPGAWRQAPYRWLRRIGASALGRRLVGVRWLNHTYHALLAWWVRRQRLVTVNGCRLWLDPHDYCGLLFGPYEAETTAWMQRTVRPGDIVVDGGAFIGYYTTLLSRLVGPSGRVFAFEPEPQAFALLERNVAENRCTNVTLVRTALGEAAARRTMSLTRSGFGGEISMQPVSGGRFVSVDTMALDDYFEGFTRPIALVKMDLEGQEISALRGARRLLQQPQMTLLVECNPAALRRAGTEPVVLLDTLGALGFGWRRLEDLNVAETADSLLAGIREPFGSANIVCKRAWAAAPQHTTVQANAGWR